MAAQIRPQGNTVHPHVRGGRRSRQPSLRAVHRFTPRAWGRLAQGEVDPSATVHPHVRGDGGIAHADFLRRLGSPPRAWGRRIEPGLGEFEGRFTPTCVGTATSACSREEHRSVHPHVRGDGHCCRNVLRRASGSPPRAWGRPMRGGVVLLTARFTPTCVGTAMTIRGKRHP